MSTIIRFRIPDDLAVRLKYLGRPYTLSPDQVAAEAFYKGLESILAEGGAEAVMQARRERLS